MPVNILDAVILILLLVGMLGGIKRGLIKELVLFLGLGASIVGAWLFRGPVSTFMYKNLPFFGFKGIFKGVSALNILLYELIAFLLVFAILILILRILLKVSGLIEKILKATIILGIFSKIAGAILGFIEAYLIIFVLLFVLNQPFINIQGMEGSKFISIILNKTPILSDQIGNTREAIDEIGILAKKYKNSKGNMNEEMLDIFRKYDIISEENINILKEKGKLE